MSWTVIDILDVEFITMKQLGELRQAGILTEAEVEQQKARILNG